MYIFKLLNVFQSMDSDAALKLMKLFYETPRAQVRILDCFLNMTGNKKHVSSLNLIIRINARVNVVYVNAVFWQASKDE